MVRLTYESLMASGIDLSRGNKSDLAITYRGQPVPRHTGGPDSRFKNGSYIDFYGESPSGSDALSISENRYQLSIDSSLALGVKMLRRNPTQWPEPCLESHIVAQDLTYANTLPSGDPFHMGLRMLVARATWFA